jgi:hypothetical protein
MITSDVVNAPDRRCFFADSSEFSRAVSILKCNTEASVSGAHRRLAKDYKNLAQFLTAFVSLAAIELRIRRIAQRQPLSQVLETSGADR